MNINRLTHAFAAAIPSSSSDASSNPPALASPQDLSVPPSSGRPSIDPTNYERHVQHIYDDPRQTHFHSPPDRFILPARLERERERTQSRRPAYLRHVSDNALTIGGRSGGATPRGVSASRERGVRADLGVGKRGKRVSGMVKGPEGRYAVGGPQCLKILHISPPSSGASSPSQGSPTRGRTQGQLLARGTGGVKVTSLADLWKPSWTVSKGVNDLDWGSGAFSNKLITATPGGNFLIFDITKAKFEREVQGGSSRPLNRVHLSPHSAYGHVLLTGSAEGQAKLWDLREHNPHTKKFYKHSAAVTALSFSPDEPQSIVVGTDNGTIKRYDIRMAPRPVGSLWGAHGNRAVMDLKWKGNQGEEGSGWMASAGADRTVQIWDMSQSWDRNPTPQHSLHTSTPVRRISWRPNHPTELAVVPHLPDNDEGADSIIEVWDVRRHNIAKYAISSGSADGGAAVDATWGEDDMGVVTAFSSGVLAQIDLRVRTLPLESIKRQVIAWSPRGEMAYGLDKFVHGEIPFDDFKPEYANKTGMISKGPKRVNDAPYRPLQAIGIVPLPETDEEDFAHLAAHYRLEGDDPARLCEWNRDVAEMVDRVDDSRLWSFLARLLDELEPTKGRFDEEIFSHSLPPTDRLPTPPASPRGGGRSDTHTPAHSPVHSSVAKSGIALERCNGQDVERLDSPTSRRSSASGFVAFQPLTSDDRRVSTRSSVSTSVPYSRTRESTATIVPPPNSRQESTASVLVMQRRHEASNLAQSLGTSPIRPAASVRPSAQSSREVSTATIPTSSALGTSVSERKSRDRTTALDYPDPYGISAAMGSRTDTSSSSQMTTREPSPAPSRGTVGSVGAGTSAGMAGVLAAVGIPGGSMYMSSTNPSTASTTNANSAEHTAETSGRQSRTGSGDRASSGSASVVQLSSSVRARSESASGPDPKSSSQRSSADKGGSVGPNGSAIQKKESNSNSTANRSRSSGTAQGSTGSLHPEQVRRKIKDAAKKRHAGAAGSRDWMAEDEWKMYKEERCRVFREWWESVLDEGNVQLACTAMIIAAGVVDLGTKRTERVAHAYIDMLERHRLPIPASYIRKFAQLLALQIFASRPGVTHVAHCQKCGKSTGSLDEIGLEKEGRRFWWCRQCRVDARVCAVCRRGVRGLWMGCHQCQHGGHQKCMRLYYMEADVQASGQILPNSISTSAHHHHHHNPHLSQAQPIPSTSSALHLPSHSAISHGHGLGSSHESSGVVPRSSSDILMQREGSGIGAGEAHDGEGQQGDTGGGTGVEEWGLKKGWNACAAGCGCKCRFVVAWGPVGVGLGVD